MGNIFHAGFVYRKDIQLAFSRTANDGLIHRMTANLIPHQVTFFVGTTELFDYFTAAKYFFDYFSAIVRLFFYLCRIGFVFIKNLVQTARISPKTLDGSFNSRPVVRDVSYHCWRVVDCTATTVGIRMLYVVSGVCTVINACLVQLIHGINESFIQGAPAGLPETNSSGTCHCHAAAKYFITIERMLFDFRTLKYYGNFTAIATAIVLNRNTFYFSNWDQNILRNNRCFSLRKCTISNFPL